MSIYGVLVGDAVGAFLEFRKKITGDMVDEAFTLPGGGAHHLNPGQITDDGELTLGLWWLLSRKGVDPSTHECESETLRLLARWYKSDPFDIGNTTETACVYAGQYVRGQLTFEGALAQIALYNAESEANGALMRIAPIAQWASIHGMSPAVAAQCARRQALLSHPSPVCQEANAVYTYLAVSLLNGMTRDRALRSTREYAQSCRTTVRHWYMDALAAKAWAQGLTPRHNIGHVKHAFMLAVQALVLNLDYVSAIRETIALGGDTDTNAAIVGGLVGIVEPIPTELLNGVLQCECDRPIEFRASYMTPEGLGS